MEPIEEQKQRAREIVDSCKFGYAGNEIDEDFAENPDVIEASYKWLVERFAQALANSAEEVRRLALEEAAKRAFDSVKEIAGKRYSSLQRAACVAAAVRSLIQDQESKSGSK